MRLRLHHIGLLVVVCAGFATRGAALSAHSGAMCSEVPGRVSFQGFHMMPAMPAVGDTVELQFEISLAVYSVTRLELVSASPLLEGNTVLYGTRDATFRLTSTHAGSANVQLAVTYGTEEQCLDSYGYPYYRFGPDHTVTSPPYLIEIAERVPACAGDCDANGQVSVDEIVVGINVVLGEAALADCAGMDRNADGLVAINEIISAINAALFGCSPATQPTPTPTRTNPPGMCCCAATSFEECQALARQGTCFGWGDPCPTLTPTP